MKVENKKIKNRNTQIFLCFHDRIFYNFVIFFKYKLLSIITFCLCEMRLCNSLCFCAMVGVAQLFESLKFHSLQLSPPP